MKRTTLRPAPGPLALPVHETEFGNLADLSPDFRAALADLHAEIGADVALADCRHGLAVLHCLSGLHDDGEMAHPNAIAVYLAAAFGWPLHAAERIGYTWSVLIGLRAYDRIIRGEPGRAAAPPGGPALEDPNRSRP
jgi:hypothetical protein